MDLIFLGILFSSVVYSQTSENLIKSTPSFWRNVQFGGGFGINLSNQFTEINLAPGALYRFNPKVAAGISLQGSFVSSKSDFSSAIYGLSLLSLINPVEEFQISVEVEQLRVNRILIINGGPDKIDNFWNTGLFIGGGYGSENVIVGIRYNLLYKESDYVYSSAMMPFIRVYF